MTSKSTTRASTLTSSPTIVHTEIQSPIGSPHLLVTPKTTTPTTVVSMAPTSSATQSAVTTTPSISVITTGNHQILTNIKPHLQAPHPQSLQAQTPIGLASASQVSLHQLQHQSASSPVVAASSAAPSTSITLSNASSVATDSSSKTNNIKTATTVAATPIPKTFSAVIQSHQQHKQSPQTVLISLTTKSNATTLQQIQHLQTSLNHPAQHSSTPPLNSTMPQTYSVYAQQQNQPQNATQVVQLVTNQQQQIQSQQPQQQQHQQQQQQQTKAQSFKYICCLQENGVRCDRAAGNASYSRRVQKTVGLRKLNYTLDPDVRHAYICEYHKTVIQSARKSPAHAREIHAATTATAANRTNFNDVSINARQQNVGLLSHHQLNNHGITPVTPNSPSVRAAAAVGYSHYPGPSLGPIDALPPSLDNGDNGSSTSSAMDVDLYQLQVNTLRRYKRHFRVQTRPGLNKLQLADSLKRHFKTMPIIEKEAITYFVYIVKCKKNKLDHNLKNSNASSQMNNDD